MKGYSTGFGYMGFVDGEYMMFASESEYREYMEECMVHDIEQNFLVKATRNSV